MRKFARKQRRTYRAGVALSKKHRRPLLGKGRKLALISALQRSYEEVAGWERDDAARRMQAVSSSYGPRHSLLGDRRLFGAERAEHAGAATALWDSSGHAFRPFAINDRLTAAATGAAAGTAAGAAVGAAAGPVGAVVGAAAGAVVGGVVGAIAGGKSCAASATGIKLGKSSSFKNTTHHGLVTPIIVRGTNLADVEDSELVGKSFDHHGSFSKVPSLPSRTSSWMFADKVPPDRHLIQTQFCLTRFDKHGGDGDLSVRQMDLFKIPKCGIATAQDMPNSGYRIKQAVKKEGKSVVGITTKTAEAVTIGSHKSSAGLTPERKAKVTLRP